LGARLTFGRRLAAALPGRVVAARQGRLRRATCAGTDVRTAPARAAGSRATHPDSAVDSPSERRGRIQCVHGAVRKDRPPEGSACARSMRADVSRRAGNGRWRASGFAPGARPTSAGAPRSCHSPVTFDHLCGASAQGRILPLIADEVQRTLRDCSTRASKATSGAQSTSTRAMKSVRRLSRPSFELP
jgi:hypothetical protein